ncbi:MAG: hypothetical protein JW394_0797 [Nitrospira sp.]|nr:hypothetical protein [Nitrospira sp.]
MGMDEAGFDDIQSDGSLGTGFLFEVDGGAERQREIAGGADAAREDCGDVPVGEQQVLADEKAGAAVVETRMIENVDAANGANDFLELGALGIGVQGLPGRGQVFRVDVFADFEDGPELGEDDCFEAYVVFGVVDGATVADAIGDFIVPIGKRGAGEGRAHGLEAFGGGCGGAED